jgi:hypothetical protein
MTSPGAATAAVALAALAVGAAACVGSDGSRPRSLAATAQHYTVRGEYSAVQLDRVDALSVVGGQVVLRGAPADLTVELPASADPQHPARHWALVSDAHVDGRRQITFTESESVTDVTIELPDGEAPVHFDVFAARQGGGEVLVFACGDREAGPPSLYGYVTIVKRT